MAATSDPACKGPVGEGAKRPIYISNHECNVLKAVNEFYVEPLELQENDAG
jgi:hypothetical protein